MLVQTAYEKEKKKIFYLLGAGLILLVMFLFGVLKEYGISGISDSFSDVSTWFIFLTIVCYPLGIAYGWRRMFGLASYDIPETGPADRYYTVQERNIHKNGIMMSWVFKIGLLITFGWVIGTYIAFKRLQYLRVH